MGLIDDNLRFKRGEHTGYGNIIEWAEDHVCRTPPITFSMDTRTMWKCGECDKVWKIISIAPHSFMNPSYYEDIKSSGMTAPMDDLRWTRAPEYDKVQVLD